MAEQSEKDTELLERGNIYFLYRPKVEHDTVEGEDDVERFYLVLKPEGARRFRLITVGQKHLPDVDSHERAWGFVDKITESADSLERSLREETYDTKTRGERHRPSARPAGEGVYAIALVDGDMHLFYALELPDKPGPAQKGLKIPPEAAFVLSVKNPEKGSSQAGLQQDQKADYPKALQEEFRDRRFATEDPRLLDYEGAELVLVGARKDPERAYGTELDPDRERYRTADIVRELHMVKSRHPVEPLLRGEWR